MTNRVTPKEQLPSSLNLPFLERLYTEYRNNLESVPPEWREYFENLEDGQGNGQTRRAPVASDVGRHTVSGPPELAGIRTAQDRVDQLMRAYRSRGHMVAQFDPLGSVRQTPPELDPAFYGLTAGDQQAVFSCESMQAARQCTLGEIIQRLRNTYCRSIGVEYMHIDDLQVRRWLRVRMETTENRTSLTRAEQVRIFTRLTAATTFEEFIRRKFVGAKSFSLEGSETLIPLLDLAIETAAEQGVREIVFGMAHRGRLNVLANILQKPPRQIFREFADVDPELFVGRGDVKYHLGHSTDWRTASGKAIHLSLSFNPSHLEFVNPVTLGRLRAKQDRLGSTHGLRSLALLIHGDASFAGQGIVQETLNLALLPGYTTGGTLHVVVNNQIGFTTRPQEGRSSTYCTDVVKFLQVPIFHVNGEDPEAVAQVVRLALEFRLEFHRDVVIDMYGYRRWGHNESDEPMFTQPQLYRKIAHRKTVRQSYLEHLLGLQELTSQEAEGIASEGRAQLEAELAESRREDYRPVRPPLKGVWAGYVGGPENKVPEVDTAVELEGLRRMLRALTQVPEGFQLHPKLRKLLEQRVQMAGGERPLDWAAGEALAFATLATQGMRVRLTGQDSERGTFSHRHTVWHDYQDGRTYAPLQHLAANQAPVEILNSPLSEAGVMGFEYGYSLEYPDALVAWEAQFGDFWNAAQVIVDQFLASAEDKWDRLSGLVLLLPHGFEGQGPEHSSARLERFLMLAAEDNFQVAIPTTPAQYFHLLRRQALRRLRKPLIVLTPKSLLRHPRVVSPLEALATGRFERVLPDPETPADGIRRVLLCSGKVYYDLWQYRADHARSDIAIVRVEQLYPLPREELRQVLSVYPERTSVLWVQEEPENMGAWRFLRLAIGSRLFSRFPFGGVFRPSSAAPATGSHACHQREQGILIRSAFGGE